MASLSDLGLVINPLLRRGDWLVTDCGTSKVKLLGEGIPEITEAEIKESDKILSIHDSKDLSKEEKELMLSGHAEKDMEALNKEIAANPLPSLSLEEQIAQVVEKKLARVDITDTNKFMSVIHLPGIILSIA